MASKTTFTPDEWNLLLQSPMLAAMAVTAADPSGLFGTVKEGFAASSALARARTDAASNELIKAVAADFETGEGRTVARDGLKESLGRVRRGEIRTKAIDSLRQVSELLERKAPDDAAPFKAWLADTAQGVAEASKEGGFLGFGGVQVSDAEKATLSEISAALNLPA